MKQILITLSAIYFCACSPKYTWTCKKEVVTSEYDSVTYYPLLATVAEKNQHEATNTYGWQCYWVTTKCNLGNVDNN